MKKLFIIIFVLIPILLTAQNKKKKLNYMNFPVSIGFGFDGIQGLMFTENSEYMNSFMMDNNIKADRKETHLETRLSAMQELNYRIEHILERCQQLEIRISGGRIKDLKAEKKMSSDDVSIPPKTSIMTDLIDLNQRTTYLLNDLEESVQHLEDYI